MTFISALLIALTSAILVIVTRILLELRSNFNKLSDCFDKILEINEEAERTREIREKFGK
jgi:hypothetical protein